jgi:2-polyprenyl-6-methoxyphenol hydroxylase-like FAD-dependent oxidoreductase
MTTQNLQVAIIGGGLGGLCLAQGLKKAGVSAAVFERDHSPSARTQGYRIHIDPQGSTALRECLPEPLWNIFASTGGEFSQGFTVMTEQLKELLNIAHGNRAIDPIAQHRSISRITLRRVLLAGLESTVQFNKRFLRYEETTHGRIVAHFEDGSCAEADILVGADGVHSRVRKQYLPHADPVDAGVVGIGGKVPLTEAILELAPRQLFDGPVMVVPGAPCSLFMAMWKRAPEANRQLHLLGIEEPLAGDEDYLLLALGGRPEYFGLENELESVSGDVLKSVLFRETSSWHPDLRKLVESMDVSEIFLNPLRTSRRVKPWNSTHITLLGDAIHSMTPYRGIGGNIALKDAALLCSKLVDVDQQKKPLVDAVAAYETAMREYAFVAVEDSRKAMEQFTGRKNAVIFPMAKIGMRAVNGFLKWRSA